MDVVVEIADWEQACCGAAIERNQMVDIECARVIGDDNRTHLIMASHDTAPEERVRGRVSDIEVGSWAEGSPGPSCASQAAGHYEVSTARTTGTWRTPGPARSSREGAEASS